MTLRKVLYVGKDCTEQDIKIINSVVIGEIVTFGNMFLIIGSAEAELRFNKLKNSIKNSENGTSNSNESSNKKS